MKIKLKIKYVILIILSVFLINLDFIEAKTIEFIDCEYTEAYKKWLKMSPSEKNKTVVPVKCKTSDLFFSSVGSSVNESYTSPKFDLRDYNYVTSVKNQEDSGTCWTFSAMASVESNLLMNGIGEYDLSEAHLAFSAQNVSFEGLMPVNRSYDDGGNDYISSAYFFNRMGPVSESDMPFSRLLNARSTGFPTKDELSSKEKDLFVKSTTTLTYDKGACTDNAINGIKKYLVNNGALSATMYFDAFDKSNIDENINDNSEIVSHTLNGAYYYYDGKTYFDANSKTVSENQDANHAVAIIGWDDTISASNFSTKPSRDGAFIIKNSYGTTVDINGKSVKMGDNGYFYVSYDDINICTGLAGFYNISKSSNDNSYYHDTLGVNYAINANSNIDLYLGNIFTKKSSGTEKLKSIAFFGGTVGQKYDILFSGDGDLSKAKVIKSGTIDHLGYTTLDIDPINITNSKFSLAMKFYYMEGETIYTFMQGIFGLYSKMNVEKGLSFVSIDGKSWDNLSLTSGDMIFPIRAYTDNVSPEEDYSFDTNSYLILDDNITYTYKYHNINLDEVTYNIFSADDAEYLNTLTYDFDIENNLESDKTITIKTNENTEIGDYVLVVKVKDITVTETFSVYLNNDTLTFLKPEDSDKPDNPDDDTVDIIVIDNPKNNDTDKTDDEVNKNSKTGDVLVFVAWTVGIGALAYSVYYFKSKKENV